MNVWVRKFESRLFWGNGSWIAKFHSPRILLSEGCESVENTGFAGKIAFSPHELGDPAGTRTPDLRLKRALLYQLSYWVIKAEEHGGLPRPKGVPAKPRSRLCGEAEKFPVRRPSSGKRSGKGNF